MQSCPSLSCVLNAFIRGYIETLPFIEAPFLCPLGLIKVKSLWPSWGLRASYSPPSLPIGTNGSHGLLPSQPSRQPNSSLQRRQRPPYRQRPQRHLPAPPHASSQPRE